MRLGIRTKQVFGVVAIVGLALGVLGGWFLASLTRILLESSRAQARLLSNMIYERTFTVAAAGGDVAAALAGDEGLRSILRSYAYSEGLVYAFIAGTDGRILADADPARIGLRQDPGASLDALIDAQGVIAHLGAIYTPGGLTFEITEPLALGGTNLGAIRIGVSTLLLRDRLEARMVTPLVTAAGVLLGSILVAALLARIVLRPIHVISTGLARLGRGETDVSVDLPPDTELSDLGDSFRQLTARLAADRSGAAGQRAIESVVDQLEDAVALFGNDGRLLFANAAMRAALGPAATPGGPDAERPHISAILPAGHPYRETTERALIDRVAQAAPMPVPDAGERLVLTNVVSGADGQPIGVLLVSRNLAYLTQVESTLSYSRKLAALNRLTAGIAHEIKNPLNATMIHLELLKMQLADRAEALESVAVIASQVRRLDEVVQGFLKFTRPEELKLDAVDLASVLARVRPILDAEATRHHIDVRLNVPDSLPAVEGDPALLEQAFLNLALNACQAMPNGGRLTITAREAARRTIVIEFEDTGIGIAPEHLSRIFDLYFTTKPQGSGLGLSMVFRTIQLHDGQIEVQSAPGQGTTFRVHLRRARTRVGER